MKKLTKQEKVYWGILIAAFAIFLVIAGWAFWALKTLEVPIEPIIITKPVE